MLEAAMEREYRSCRFTAAMVANLMNIHLKRGVTVDDLMGGKPAVRQRPVDESEVQKLAQRMEERRQKTKSGRLRGRRTAEDIRREDAVWAEKQKSAKA